MRDLLHELTALHCPSSLILVLGKPSFRALTLFGAEINEGCGAAEIPEDCVSTRNNDPASLNSAKCKSSEFDFRV